MPATEAAKEPAPEPAAEPASEPADEPADEAATAPSRRSLGQLEPLLLLRAAHPRQALLTAAALAGVAAVDGRAGREVAVVFATVLVGQAMLGWHNDLVDRKRDLEDERPRKPVADGSLDPGTVWFVIACATLLVVPLSITSGLVAGATYLIALAVGLLGNVLFRKGWLSWLTWAVSFGLYPAYLSYGGWGGEYDGDPPTIAVTALAGRPRRLRPLPAGPARPGDRQPARLPAPAAAGGPADRGAPADVPLDRRHRAGGRRPGRDHRAGRAGPIGGRGGR